MLRFFSIVLSRDRRGMITLPSTRQARAFLLAIAFGTRFPVAEFVPAFPYRYNVVENSSGQRPISTR